MFAESREIFVQLLHPLFVSLHAFSLESFVQLWFHSQSPSHHNHMAMQFIYPLLSPFLMSSLRFGLPKRVHLLLLRLLNLVFLLCQRFLQSRGLSVCCWVRGFVLDCTFCCGLELWLFLFLLVNTGTFELQAAADG